MSDLIAIGYPDETTALKAEEEAQHLAEELIIQPDAIAAIVRHKDGKFKVTTNHHSVATGTTWGMWWGFLFGILFFVPVIGAGVGAAAGAIWGKLEDVGVDDDFIANVKEKVTEGTSALFLLSSGAVADRIRQRFAGTHLELIESNLSAEDEAALRDRLGLD